MHGIGSKRLKDKSALVTSAGSGSDKAIALGFASEAARVTCADRNGAAADVAANEIRHAGGEAKSIAADVAIAADCQRQVDRTVEAFGRLDILVNNAGGAFHRLFLDTTLEDWERRLRVNLTGQFLTAQAAARVMVVPRAGRILNMGSISGQRGGTGRSAYGKAKAGLITNHGPKQTKVYLDRIPAGEYGRAEHIAAAAMTESTASVERLRLASTRS